MDYQALILHRLLDKYEESRHFLESARVNRKVTLKFTGKDFPQYDLEKPEVKEAVHFAVGKLKESEIIDLKWMKFEEGNILEKVRLNLEKLEEAYRLAERKPKKDRLGEVHDSLTEMRNAVQTPWIGSFLDACISAIENEKAFPKYLPQDDELWPLLISALAGIEEKGSDEMLERVFSRKYLKGSKELERKVRSRLVTVIKEFFPLDKDLEDEEALQTVGLIKTSEDLLFRGPLEITLLNQGINFSPFVFGTSMNSDTIKKFAVKKLKADRIITIENKASYLEYIKNKESGRELVVYLGGFYSPVKKIFLEKIRDYIQENRLEIPFFHWGDIDLGGFNIFLQVLKLIPEVKPYLMDGETLNRFASLGDKIGPSYEKKLSSLLDKPEYTVFHETIREMLRLGIKLEQEAVTVNDEVLLNFGGV